MMKTYLVFSLVCDSHLMNIVLIKNLFLNYKINKNKKEKEKRTVKIRHPAAP